MPPIIFRVMTKTLAAIRMAAVVGVVACHGRLSTTTVAPATRPDTSQGRYISIRGHSGPFTGPGAVALAVDSIVLCPHLDSAGVAWPPTDLPALDPAHIDTTVVLRGRAMTAYAHHCPMPLDAVVRITTRRQSGVEGP